MKSKSSMNRRNFLGLGVAGAGLYALGRPTNPLAALEGGLDGPLGKDEKILIIVQMSGGNDGLNTLVPFGDPEYARARRRIGIAKKDVRQLEAGMGLHPSLKGLSELYKAKKLAVLQGVGYPNPNRSHFKSMDIWHAADPTGRDMRYGWLGRALDEVERNAANIPELSINFAENPPLSLNGLSYKPVSFRDPFSYRFAGSKDQDKAFKKISKEKGETKVSVLESLRRTAVDAEKSSVSVRSKAQAYKTPVKYPRSQLSGSLRTVAGLIAGGLPTRVYYCYHNGFDTHAGQANRHANLLTQMDQAIAAFQKDLARLGLEDRVCLMAFSEFGRRVKENQSQGTDHGTAGVSFVVGGSVRGGLYGEPPSLTDLLKGGDLKHGIDFRSLYADLLEGTLDVDSKKVLRGKFEKLGILA
jgi:uncharacterized protein (DUF1501 family)